MADVQIINADCNIEMAKMKKLIAKKKKARRDHLWYEKNKEHCTAKAREYREKNRSAYNKYRLHWRTKEPSGIFDATKQSAKRRKIAFEMTRSDFVEWYKAQDKKCTYCLRTEEEVNKDVLIVRTRTTRLTIDRKNNDEGYKVENLTLCCIRCNVIKSNYFTYDEMIEVGKIITRKCQCQK